MAFEAPYWWFALLPLGVYLWWLHRRSYAQLKTWARFAGLGARLALILLMLAALARPVWRTTERRTHLVFALDVSESLSPESLDAALIEIDRLASEAFRAGHARRVSLVAFGERAVMLLASLDRWPGWTEDQRDLILHRRTRPDLQSRIVALRGEASSSELESLEARLVAIESFRDQTVGDQTDLEAGLRLASNCGRTGEPLSLVLLTDGNESAGDWRRAATQALGAGLALRVIALDHASPPEVALTELTAPVEVRVHESFRPSLRLVSTIDTSAAIRVFKDGFEVVQRVIAVRAGPQSIELPELAFDEGGFHTLLAEVRAESDTELRNNTIRAVVVVPGRSRVLYIDSNESQMPYLKNALELQGFSVDARPPLGLPASLSDLLSFDALILSNVPADQLGPRQMEMIRSYVSEFGGGFIMLGGEQSFGLGGYYGTPIEEILPVRMPIQKDMLRPALALFLVLDKSGSMTGVKIELAKRAAIATSEAINPRDEIGLVGFDTNARVLLDLTPALDRAAIGNAVNALSADGGTNLHPALTQAFERLRESSARRKHVIILSDGQTEGSGYEDLVRAMVADGITVSAIGIGDGAEMNLLESLASIGGGRSYFTNDFFSIPQIFTREALRASNSMLVERLVEPVVLEDDTSLDGIDTSRLPLLSGYVATTPKAAARTIIASDTADPIFARWRYGLGWTAAFTSETKPRWAEDWILWPEFSQFWGQVVRSVSGKDLANRVVIRASHRMDGASVVLSADLQDERGGFVVDRAVHLARDVPGRGLEDIPVTRESPGLYAARLQNVPYGEDQRFVWRIDPPPGAPPDATSQTESYAVTYPYSREFQTLGPDRAALRHIAAAAGDTPKPTGETTLTTLAGGTSTQRRLWPLALVLAVLLIPADILIRRIG